MTVTFRSVFQLCCDKPMVMYLLSCINSMLQYKHLHKITVFLFYSQVITLRALV